MGGGVWVVLVRVRVGRWGYSTGGGTLLGGLALEISVVCFSCFQDGRGLKFEFEFGLVGGCGGGGGSSGGWVGV